ncbi:FHA domain-containing protein [Cellulomonas wangsupingiae]|uniref:FHA domain-containing protein n=1 Tax=Cellulomonas wangsupingiae TaxID=2968085 RepID=A0ABY5K2J1_9CELL|nr:FHA domain-containing protein [Cellulomonas wangsupingiae]MCC2336460.1 FHA domain-containing protein [Cellulomonas wangsupingiae]UUI64662.1 FHA domain-containing protein [Cellulomonas wangsupingiae]
MSVTCPEGHTSASTDYCDVCGAPIGTPSAVASPTPSAAAPTPATCPHCGSPAATGALFCENCGYDFTTGAAPHVPATSSLDLGATAPAPAGAATAGAPTTAVPSGTGATPAPDPLEPPPAVASPPGTGAAPPSSVTSPATGASPTTTDPSAPLAPPLAGDDAWVAELWIDPDWYAAQQAEDPMPSVGLPVLVPLRERSVLVGRPSASRNIRPQVDAGADSGVSRRHCQLNTDGHRWWVEDLQSSNGTFVARVGEALPENPIRPGQRHELQDGDRLYIGSWTRLVVRRALPGEV